MKDYKRILKGVVNIINITKKSDIGFANICAYIGENCPELKESEDEKIRKSLLEYLHTLPNHYAHSGVCSTEWIAWLEKQGEQKLCVNDNAKEMFIKALERVEEQNNKGYKLTDCDKNSWWEDFKAYTSCTIVQKPANKIESGKKFTPIESALKDLICDVDNSYTIEQVRRFLFEYGYKDKILNAAQEEMQNPAEWSEEDERTYKSITYSFAHNYPLTVRQQEFVKFLKDRVQRKQEWSEEDEKIVLSIEQVMNCASLLNIVQEKVDKIRTWLKSLKDRVQPQHKEWSEEDDAIRNDLINYFRGSALETSEKEVINWLKSLRPQNTWKPSDAQMDVLLSEVTAWTKGCHKQIVLESLYNDLKNLK